MKQTKWLSEFSCLSDYTRLYPSWLYKCNFLPIYGNVSEFGGIVSETINMKTATDKRTVISIETFSPDSGGNINPSNAIDDINIHGNRRLRT